MVFSPLLSLLLIADTAGGPPLSLEELAAGADQACEEALAVRDGPRAPMLFRKAAKRYENLRRRGLDSALLERNLGNAWFLAGDVPRAILAYRRGLGLGSHDQALRDGLEYARAHVRYVDASSFGRPPKDGWLPAWTRTNATVLGTLAFSLYALAWALLARAWITQKWLLLAAMALAWAGVAGAAGILLAQVGHRQKDTALPPVIVAQDGVLLRKGNGLAYPPAHPIPLWRGVEARRRFVRADWVQLELAGGEVGWVPRQALVMDEP